MATVAEFTLPAGAFPLGHLFEEVPDAAIELDRVVPTGQGPIPYVWVQDADPDIVDTAADDVTGLVSVEVVDRTDTAFMCRVEWDSGAPGITACLVEAEVMLVSGTGRADGWTFEVRSESADGISTFRQCCVHNDIHPTLTRFHTLDEADIGDRYGLTPEQEEALVLAYDKGYYGEPRETTLEELADELGISRPSLAGRLKRGYGSLVGSTLVHPSRNSG